MQVYWHGKFLEADLLSQSIHAFVYNFDRQCQKISTETFSNSHFHQQYMRASISLSHAVPHLSQSVVEYAVSIACI